MWLFKPREIDNYRICLSNGVYTIQKYCKSLDRWETLHYYPYMKKYKYWATPENEYVLSFKTLQEARNKVSEVIPQYFSAETPDYDY